MGSVIVVGAGPAGAFLSYLLASRGVDVTLLERHHSFDREFRGEDLFHAGIKAIQQAGLADQLAALPRAKIAVSQVFTKGRLAFTMPWSDDEPGPHSAFAPNQIPQPEMLAMLTAEAAKHLNFKLKMGARVRQLLMRSGRVVGVEIEQDGHRSRLEADFVIGCDGRTSVVRKRAGLDGQRLGDEQVFDVAWTRGEVPHADRNKSMLFLGPGRVVIFFPTHRGDFQIGTILEKGEFGAIRSLGVHGWLDMLEGFVSASVIDALRRQADTIKLNLLDVVCYALPVWTRPGLLLIGDAAHPMSPAGGQGLSQALRDAVAVCNEMSPLLCQPAPDPHQLDVAAATVQAQREPEVHSIQRAQRRVPKVLFQRTWYSRLAFRHALPIVARLSPALLQWLLNRSSAPFHRGTSQLDLICAPEAVPTGRTSGFSTRPNHPTPANRIAL
ncbi:FAD-dependent monooxygenase [Mycobacterium sp. Marseille-P9652]|uniref:FAD-dependent monooxygenase n=1 Tax=Mycobacterium sp. Marseille-P9652 TaxID=2654950 RepID=UPI0012E716E8|nr:FAD-dependent monooxygenase [Mycobacterium sp. Marseille-P9652]